MRVHYETTECSRCGGTGTYSYCQQWGSICFGCGGNKVQLTPLGKKAKKAYDAFCNAHRATKLASEIVVGDRIRVGGDPFRRVTEISRDGSAQILSDGTRVPMVSFTFNKPTNGPLGKSYTLGMVITTKVTVAMTSEAQAEAFARTLKGATVSE